MNISDTVSRKFVDSVDVQDYEILTDSGWHDCVAVHKTVEYTVWRVKTENHELRCADDHIMFMEGMREVFAKDLQPGDVIMTEDGAERVLSVQPVEASENMFDVELADNTEHRYYTNGILSHNTTSYTIFALWTLIFNAEQRIMLLANKADTAIEILSRIQLAYEYLPTWLKPAVVVWNKSEIIFSNKSAIKGFATASDSARGYSANCVNKDSIIYIRSKYLKWLKIPIKIKRLKTIANIQGFIMSLPNMITRCLLKFKK